MKWIENLKSIMSEKGVNIEQLKNSIEQEGSKLSRNTISNILHGNNNPKIETLEVIAKALNIEVWQLFASSPTTTTGTDLNGFVEHNGTIHKIQAIADLENLLEQVKK